MKLKFIIVKFISIILKKYAKESCLYDIIDIFENVDYKSEEIFKIFDGFQIVELMVLKKWFSDLTVKPNYLIDDEGLPRRHAGGGLPDIVCYNSNNYSLFEVTLLTGNQQCVRELPSIGDHLRESRKTNENAFSVFIAPTIHHRSYEYAEFLNFKDKLLIVLLSIIQFTRSIESGIEFDKLKNKEVE